jgi:enoyl-CoA hydratase/carnithine racemase
MIRTETSERIARIRFDRPEKKNAITAQMYEQLAGALASADADPGVRAILIHGRPDCFTAGNDLADFLERPPREETSGTFRVLKLLPALAKPVVGAVGGPAVGIGTTLLLHCELVYASPGARFQLPFVALGVVPEAGSSLLLPLLAGYQRAAELLLLGEPFGADKAYECGLVTRIVPEPELLERALEAARALAALPPASVQLTKKLMKSPHSRALARQMAEEGRRFRERLSSPEAKEAMSAFLEKRKPDFSRF